MGTLNLKRLRHVVALADVRHFGHAAESCNLSQPAFSRSIQLAEKSLGLQLFNRTSAEVTCTDAGAFVVERARKLLFESRCLERDVSLYLDKKVGDVAFGVGPYPAATILLDLLTELRTRYPGINTHVEVTSAPNLTKHLRNETIDFFVASAVYVPSSPDLVVMPLGRLYADFIVRAGHPLRGQSVRLADLLPWGLATVDVAEEVRLQFGRIAGLLAGTPFPCAVTCDDVSVLKGLALATDTVVVCPIASMEAELEHGAVVPLRVIDVEPMFAPLVAVSLRGRTLSAIADISIEILSKLVK